MEKKQSVGFPVAYHWKKGESIYGNVFHTIDLLNSIDWILPQSIVWKYRIMENQIHSISNKGPYNFYTMYFQIIFPCIMRVDEIVLVLEFHPLTLSCNISLTAGHILSSYNSNLLI